MQIFPDEYKHHIRPFHKWAIIVSAALILAGLTGIVLLTIAPTGSFPGSFPVLARKFLGGLIVFGIPAGLLILTSALSLVTRKYNKKRRESLGAKESVIFSTNLRTNVIRTIAHLKYDYRNASNTWFKTAVLLITPFAIIGVIIIINDPEPSHAFFVGILFFFGPLCSLGLGWFILIKPKRFDYIELAVDGIHYQTKGNKAFLPWHKAKEIQNLRGSYAITSEDDRLIIWSDIEPSSIPSESFFAGLFREGPYVRDLIQSIKTLAPHIYQKESLLTRDVKLPVSNKVIVVLLVMLALLLFIVILRGMANI